MDIVDTLRAIGALILVLGIILGLAWGVQRFGGRFGLGGTAQRTGDLKVVEYRPLDARRKLAVVRWGDTEHLISLGPSGDCSLAQRPAPEPLADDTDKPGGAA